MRKIYVIITALILLSIFILLGFFTYKYFTSETTTNYIDTPEVELFRSSLTDTSLTIPKIIFQTCLKKDSLDLNTIKSIKLLQEYNIDMEYYLYDLDDSENLIKEHFDDITLSTYNSSPINLKLDFLKYCLLYVYGGIYIDINLRPKLNFSFKNLLADNNFMTGPDGKISTEILILEEKNLLIHQLITNMNKTQSTPEKFLTDSLPNLTTNLRYDRRFVYYNNCGIMEKISQKPNFFLPI